MSIGSAAAVGLLLFTLAARLVAQAPAAAGAPRDAGPAVMPVGTAEISGVVVADGAAATPLRRVTLTLRDTDRGATRTALTDDTGAFRFTELPDGRYTLDAAKPSYVRTVYGARTRGGPGLTTVVERGQRVSGLRIVLQKGGVLTGRVTDEYGRPIPSVRVQAAERVVVGGQPSFRPVGGLGGGTDDRGEYRLHSLPPGDYVIVASILGSPLGGAPRATTDAEVRWALAPPAVAPGTSRPIASTAPPPGKAVRFVTTFYPSGTDASLAAIVPLAAGEEKGGLDMTASFTVTATVAGRVSRPDGQPVRNALVVAVPLDRTTLNLPIIDIPPRASVLASGEFSVSGMAPGRYLISARASSGPPPSPAVSVGIGGPAPANDLWAAAEVSVGGEDVSGVRLDLAPGMNVGGRITFEGTTPPPAIDSTVNVGLGLPPGAGAAIFGGGNTTVNADGTFTMPSVAPGSFLVTASLRTTTAQLTGLNPPAWMLKSITLDGRDITDTPFELRAGADITNIDVTFIDRVTQLTGRVLDQAGRPVPTYSVIVFTTDTRQWRQGSRWLRQPIRPASDGRYAINALPPGDYYLAVIPQFEPNEWYTPAFLQQVVPGAIRITIGEGERKTQDLRLGQ